MNQVVSFYSARPAKGENHRGRNPFVNQVVSFGRQGYAATGRGAHRRNPFVKQVVSFKEKRHNIAGLHGSGSQSLRESGRFVPMSGLIGTSFLCLPSQSLRESGRFVH